MEDGFCMARFNFLKDKKIELEEHPIKLGNLEYLLNKETFYAIFEKHPDIVFTLDIHGKVLHYNPSFKQILGMKKRTWIKTLVKFI